MSEPEQKSFAEEALATLDRVIRHAEQLRYQLRVADEFLLARETLGVAPHRVSINNAHVQSLGFNVKLEGNEVVIDVVHRGGDCQQEIRPQTTGTWEVGDE